MNVFGFVASLSDQAGAGSALEVRDDAAVSTAPKEVAAISHELKHTLAQIHGICFVLAWFLFVTIAAVAARYFREYKPHVNPWGLRIWYH
ncbi:hypothetical protein AAVH_39326, partial [Aphelenchoides avenae]